ncbi:PREDICTED: probable thionin-2.4 [Camelina sativa]|uniref:Probable thionin-2.4 n=1 Tax=Camelina sativa TaxID=90675 RepID=A0ABM0W2M5_CAMSA|nr:PREDICTED: probable thionin-2.4 [Camelina sativa]
MEGKNLILTVLVMSLFIPQIQVDAKSCCPSSIARSIYISCRLAGSTKSFCARLGKCIFVSAKTCPDGYTNDIFENTGDVVHEYCKLGCVSSVCSALTTLGNSDGSETEAIKKCASACSTVCTKGSMNVTETA